MAEKKIKFSRKADSLQAWSLYNYLRIYFIPYGKHSVTVTNTSHLKLFKGTVQGCW